MKDQEAPPQGPEVVKKVPHRTPFLVAVSKHDRKVVGQPSLDGFEHVRVRTELNYEIRLDGTSQLGVTHFVMMIAEPRCPRLSDKEIGETCELLVFQSALIDEFRSPLHRLDGQFHLPLGRQAFADFGDIMPFLP